MRCREEVCPRLSRGPGRLATASVDTRNAPTRSSRSAPRYDAQHCRRSMSLHGTGCIARFEPDAQRSHGLLWWSRIRGRALTSGLRSSPERQTESSFLHRATYGAHSRGMQPIMSHGWWRCNQVLFRMPYRPRRETRLLSADASIASNFGAIEIPVKVGFGMRFDRAFIAALTARSTSM